MTEPSTGAPLPGEMYWYCQLDPYFTIQPLFDVWGVNLPIAVDSYDALANLAPDGSKLEPQTYASLITAYDPDPAVSDPADPTTDAQYHIFIVAYNILSITRVDELGNSYPIVTEPVPIKTSTIRFVDIEVPLDIKFHYDIVTDYEPGVLTQTDWCYVPSTAWAPNYPQICVPALLSDPILVARATWVGLQGIDPLSWPGRRTIYDIVSGAYPIAQSDVRSMARTSIRVITFTLSQRQSFLNVLAAGRILLLRIPDRSYPESFWYISIGDVTEERILTDHRRPERRWTLDVVVVQRPVGDISYVGTARTYELVRDFEPDAVTPISPRTYAGTHDDYLDYLGLELGIQQQAFDDSNLIIDGQSQTFSPLASQVYVPAPQAPEDPDVTVGRNPTANAVRVTQWTTTP